MSLEHLLGLDGEQVYNLLSGLVPCLLGSGFIVSWVRHHNCHESGCWRLGHPDPEHGYPVCHKHQKRLKGGR